MTDTRPVWKRSAPNQHSAAGAAALGGAIMFGVAAGSMAVANRYRYRTSFHLTDADGNTQDYRWNAFPEQYAVPYNWPADEATWREYQAWRSGTARYVRTFWVVLIVALVAVVVLAWAAWSWFTGIDTSTYCPQPGHCQQYGP